MGTRYTDVSGLPLEEWSKLPWLGRTPDGYSHLHSQKSGERHKFREMVAEFVERVQMVVSESFSEERGPKTL
jgi:hypothetical protein